VARRRMVALVCAAALLTLAYTQLTFFAVQPIGAVPDGVTLIIPRSGRLKFIDSADAVCERETGSVTLLCRVAVLGAVAKNSQVLIRLPYSETLYSSSRGSHKKDARSAGAGAAR
jgi:hypothetical protein